MRRFINRSVRHAFVLAFEIMALLAAVLLLGWGGLLYRLEQGPIKIGFLQSPLQEVMNANLTNYDVSFGSVQLGWDGFRTPVELQMTDVAVADKQTHVPLASVSRIGLEISKTALLSGDLAARSVNFYDIGLRVHHDATSGLSLQLGRTTAGGPQQGDIRKTFESFMSDQWQQGEKKSNLQYLKTLRIIGADVLFDSEKLAEPVTLKKARIILKKDVSFLTVALDGMLDIEDTAAPLSGYAYYSRAGDMNRASLNVTGFTGGAVRALLAPGIQQKLVLNGEVKATLHAGFTNDLTIHNASLDMQVSNGRINYDHLFETPVVFAKAVLDAEYTRDNRKFDITQAEISGENLHLRMHGVSEWSGQDGRRHSQFEAETENLPINDIARYWPSRLAVDARTWVTENIREGSVTRAYQKAVIEQQGDQLIFKEITGDIEFDRAQVKYLPAFPAVEDVKGRAAFDLDGFNIAIEKGRYRDVILKPSRVNITGYGSASKIDIALDMTAGMKDALFILDSAPYHFTRDMGLPMDRISGTADVSLGFSFPLDHDLDSADIKVTAQAASENISWQDIYKGQDLTAAKINFTASQEAMTIKGSGLLAGTPTVFDWQSRFDDPHVVSSLKAETTVSLSDYLPENIAGVNASGGRVPVKIEQQALKDGNRRLHIEADIANAFLDARKIGIEKPAGMPGRLSMDAVLAGEYLSRLYNMQLDSAAISLKGDMDFDAGEWSAARFHDVTYGNNDFAIEAKNLPARIEARISGRRFDISGALEGGRKDKNVPAAENRDHPKAVRGRAISLSGNIAELVTSRGQAIKNAEIFLAQNDRRQVERLELNGIAGSGEIYLRYKPDDQGLQTLRIEADDAGAALRTLGVTKSVRGGVLVVEGKPAGQSRPRDLEGRFQISHFTVVDAPVLARLLNGVSISGLAALLNGEGIEFSQLGSQFSWSEQTSAQGVPLKKVLTVREGKTAGASLGLTFDGVLDVLGRRMDIEGNLVPLSGLNKAVSEIPVFGNLLTGGGDGVFAATYTIKGDMDNPTITVNPLAALAPGVLRNIFFEGGTP